MNLLLHVRLLLAGIVIALSLNASPAQEAADKDAQACETSDNDAKAGIDACTRVLDHDAKAHARRRAVMLTYRALAFRLAGKIQESAADLSEAIALSPDFPPAYEARANL